MKVIKLTATALQDIELARNRALPLKRADFPPDDGDLYDSEEYDRMIRGSPQIVQATERVLADTQLWQKSAIEPVSIESYHDYRTAFGMSFEGKLLLYQDCLYDVRGVLTNDQRSLLVLERPTRNGSCLSD